jgi:cadmium resistance protein CadD (predicted permease)
MAGLPGTIGAAAALFAGTNVDDIVVLAVLNASSRTTGRPRRWEIWAGQYAGFGVLVAVSVAAARGLDLIPHGWFWLFGLLPLGLGIWGLAMAFRARRRGEPPPAPAPGGLAGVTGLTIANGGDDIAVYTPFFATVGGAASVVTVATFAVGVALWCLAGAWLVSHRRVTEFLRTRGHWIVPCAFLLVAVYIFWKTAAFAHLR